VHAIPRSRTALEADPDIGLLLPCNVVVREEADKTITVAFMDPEAVLQWVDKTDVHALGRKVRALLQRVCTSLKAQHQDGSRARSNKGRETPWLATALAGVVLGMRETGFVRFSEWRRSLP
jgi:hypothetical protein